jgi:hypothetical protein
MKIFISYSTKDRSTAAALYRDLRKGGAAAFQFGKSETAGKPAWDQIIRWINECDAFVVLISSNAVGSTAVAEEIAMAHDCYINSERTKPSKIIPAIIEARVKPPLLIRRMSFLDLVNYEAGLPKLLRELGLKAVAPAPKSAARALPAIDFDKLAREHAEANPPSAEQKRFRSSVKSLLTNYDDLKPADLPKKTEEQHVDSLVADLMGKSPDRFASPKQVASANEAFLGVKQPEAAAVADRLLSTNRSELARALPAPKLRLDGDTLRWTPVLGATAYVVERQDGSGTELVSSKEVYRGTDLSFYARSLYRLPPTFRVKATAGVFRMDSPWSNAVKLPLFIPKKTLLSAAKAGTPEAPSLTIDRGSLMWRISWTAVAGATSYVLERGRPAPGKVLTDRWTCAYKGPETEFADRWVLFGVNDVITLYRVKAVGPWGETAWGS